jgi:hypothetical protein
VTVSDLLGILKPEEKARLHHMFELGQPDFIIVTLPGKERWFIGVHLHYLEHLVLEDEDGSWAIGRYK